MKKRDYLTVAPGKIIQTLQGYNAFIPDPLPPNMVWANDLLNTLSKADRSLSRLAEIGNAFPAPHVVVRPFIRKEAVLSSQIEGTLTSFQGLLSFEAGQLGLFTDLEDVREVQNYVKALDYGMDRMRTLPLSSRLIREIHGILMENVRGEMMKPGEFRKNQNWIGRPGAALENARYVPPPVAEMHTCLADLEKFIHSDSDLPPILRIGMIHYQFEAIHPFLDGNGRMGRLLVTLLLVAWGLLPQPLLYLSNFIETNRQEYYDRLLAVSQKGAWEDWLLYFLEGVHTQAEDGCSRITRLQALREKYHAMIKDDRSHKKLALLIDYLISTPITSVNQAKDALNMGSFTTIQRAINKLQEVGIISEVTGQTRNRIYRADEILKFLEDPLDAD